MMGVATERYDRGLTDFLNVLDAQRQQYEIEEVVIVAQQVAAIEFVIFYKSLGGGWERIAADPRTRAGRSGHISPTVERVAIRLVASAGGPRP